MVFLLFFKSLILNVLFLCYFPPSGSLCIIQTDHLPLEELYEARLPGLPSFEKRKWQEEPAAWVTPAASLPLSYSFVNSYKNAHGSP